MCPQFDPGPRQRTVSSVGRGKLAPIVEDVTMTLFEFFIGVGLLSFVVGLVLLNVSFVRTRRTSLTGARLRVSTFASLQFAAGFLMLSIPVADWIGPVFAVVFFAAGFGILYLTTRLKGPPVEPKRVSSNQSM